MTTTRHKKPPYVLIGILTILVLVAAVALVAVFKQVVDNYFGTPPSIVEVAQGGAAVVNPPRELNDFTLTSHTGDPLSLSDLRGKPVLMSFGFTHCPDVCPLTLMEYQRIREMLGDDADRVEFVFISVDGERDTPERLARYFETRKVDDFAIGMTGTEAQLRSLSADYGLSFEKNFDTGSQANYLIDHTANTYLVDTQGRLTTIFGFGTEPQVIHDHIQSLLS
jgi:protein SCO1/2